MCSKRGGEHFRDVGPVDATAHQLGPTAALYIVRNDELAVLSDQRKRDVLEELIQFVGVISRHLPTSTNGDGMRVDIDDSVEFLRRMPKKTIDGILSTMAAGLVPVCVVELWRGSVLGSGEFVIGGSDE